MKRKKINKLRELLMENPAFQTYRFNNSRYAYHPRNVMLCESGLLRGAHLKNRRLKRQAIQGYFLSFSC